MSGSGRSWEVWGVFLKQEVWGEGKRRNGFARAEPPPGGFSKAEFTVQLKNADNLAIDAIGFNNEPATRRSGANLVDCVK